MDSRATEAVEQTLFDLHAAETEPGTEVTYPGERLWRRRADNIEHGIPVDPHIWQEVLRLAGR